MAARHDQPLPQHAPFPALFSAASRDPGRSRPPAADARLRGDPGAGTGRARDHPGAAGATIVDACKAELYDMAALGEAAVAAGNVAIPVIKALTAEVEKIKPQAARYVHWGATSQDAIDTALVLELRAAIDALLTDLDRAILAFTGLAGRHRRTPSVARTWLQHALPMPFGLKVAGYAAALSRSRERLRRLRKEALLLQLGGAAGTLAASATAASMSSNGLPACSICRCPTRRGTATATGSPRSPRPLRSSPAPAARSRATSR